MPQSQINARSSIYFHHFDVYLEKGTTAACNSGRPCIWALLHLQEPGTEQPSATVLPQVVRVGRGNALNCRLQLQTVAYLPHVFTY